MSTSPKYRTYATFSGSQLYHKYQQQFASWYRLLLLMHIYSTLIQQDKYFTSLTATTITASNCYRINSQLHAYQTAWEAALSYSSVCSKNQRAVSDQFCPTQHTRVVPWLSWFHEISAVFHLEAQPTYENQEYRRVSLLSWRWQLLPIFTQQLS